MEARTRDEIDLVGANEEQLRNKAFIKPDKAQRDPADDADLVHYPIPFAAMK
jgi:hypothetical protein